MNTLICYKLFRSGHAVVTTTQGTFAVGGAQPDAPQVEQFDVATKQWDRVPGMDVLLLGCYVSWNIVLNLGC